MGLYGLLLGGWCSVMAVMADSSGAVRLRTIMLFVLVAAVAYRVLRASDKLPDGSTGMVTGALVGLIAGGAVASMVKLIGPSSIVPATLLVLAFALSRWVIRSVGRAAAVIEQTTAEFAVPDRSGADHEANSPSLAVAQPDRHGPSSGPSELHRHHR